MLRWGREEKESEKWKSNRLKDRKPGSRLALIIVNYLPLYLVE